MRYLFRARWSNLLVLITLLFSLGFTSAQAGQGPGDPDPTSIPGLENLSTYAVKLLADGRMLVAGTDGSAKGILARVLPNGQLDSTFGPDGSGLASIDFLAGQDDVFEVDVDGDGNILVVASADGDLSNVTLARYTGKGALHPISGANNAIGAAAAVELDVDTTADNQTLMACTSSNGDCSLRGAIRKANLDTAVLYRLQLNPTTYTLTFVDSGDGDTDLDIRTHLEIYGGGARVDAGGTSRAFDVSVNMVVTQASLYLENVDLTNGDVTAPAIVDKRGGAIRADYGSTLTLKNVSVIGNQAVKGGGIFIDHLATLTNVTFDGNTATTGSGLEISGGATVELIHVSLLDGLNSNSGTLSMQNSVLADYLNGPGTSFCDGNIQTRGDNLFEDLDGCVIVGEVGIDITGQPAGLSSLQSGSLLRYALPDSTSPLVNNAACLPSVTTDQLGNPRSGPTCDIGAIERQNTTVFTDWIYLPIISNP